MFQIVDGIVEDLTFGVSGVKWKFSMESLSDKDEDWESLADSGVSVILGQWNPLGYILT